MFLCAVALASAESGPEGVPALSAADPPTAVAAEPAAAPEARAVAPPRNAFHGFRAQVPAGPPAVGTRIALVQDFNGAFVGELTLRGQSSWRWFGMAAEVVGAAAGSELWSGAGLGNTKIDLAFLFGPPRATHALGLQITAPPMVAPVTFWGTVSDATIFTAGLALAWNGTRGRFGWHIHAGLRSQQYFAYDYSEYVKDIAASLATVQPVAAGWFIVGEVEALNSPSPFHARALARHDFGGGWTVDAGFATPFPAVLVDPTLQIIGQIAYSFPIPSTP